MMKEEANELELVKETELARLLGVHRTFLTKLRKEGKGPRCIQLGKGCVVFYDMADVREWLEANKQQ